MAKVKLAHGLRRGEILDLTVESLANGGDGVARAEGVPVFIERAAAGDRLKVKLFDVRKDFARGEIVEVVTPSVERVQPPCQHYSLCGGCQWQHIDYKSQLAHKESLVRQSLRHIGGMGGDQAVPVETICGAVSEDNRQGDLHYRNKAQFPVQYVHGRYLAGYYGRGSHDLVDVEHCSIQPQSMDGVLASVRRLLKNYRVHTYDEKTHKGLIRHVNIRRSVASGRQLVTLVVNHPPVKYAKMREQEELAVLLDLARDLIGSHDDIEGIVLNFNPHKGNRILGEESLILLGGDFIEEVLKSERSDLPERLRQGLKIRLSSSSFFQVNTRQAVALLEVIAEMTGSALAGLASPVIVDAYAGVGTIALWLAAYAGSVVAVEENGEAIDDGRANAALNGLNGVEFVHGRVEDVLEKLMTQGTLPDLLVVDPPRKGLAPEVLAAVKEHGPQHLIYVSCNPTTLARDLKMLCDGGGNSRPNGYKTKRIKPVDLFPHTYHVETVVQLERL